MTRAELDGTIAISAKALNRVVTAITAEQLRVAPSTVGISLADDSGLLGISVTAPLRMQSLAAADGQSVLARCTAAQVAIRDRVGMLTGNTVSSVAIRISRARVLAESRVR